MASLETSLSLSFWSRVAPEEVVSGFDIGILHENRPLAATEALARTYDSEVIGDATVTVTFEDGGYPVTKESVSGGYGNAYLALGSRPIKFESFGAICVRLRKKWPAAGLFGSVAVATSDVGYDPALSGAQMPDLHVREYFAASVNRGSGSGYTVEFTLPDAGADGTSATGDENTDLITASGHVWCNDLPVELSASSGGAGLGDGNYYIRDLQPDGTFKLTDTLGGDAIDFTTPLTAGTLTPRFTNLLVDIILFGNRP